MEIFDFNNPDARPLKLMSNVTGTGTHWYSEVGSGEIFYVVNEALLAFAKQKAEWSKANYAFTSKDAVNFLIDFMKQVSSFLR